MPHPGSSSGAPLRGRRALPRPALRAALGLGLAGACALGALAGCNRLAAKADADAGADAAATEAPPAQGQNSVAPPPPPDKPLLGITSFVATVYKEPRDTSKKLGYLRVGAKIARSAEPVGKAGCPGGWYEIFPRGFVCAGKDATTDLDDPAVRAGARRPNLETALPYRYAFVRAVLPMYLRVPTADEQYKSEFKLDEHLTWYKQNEAEVTKVILGAPDVAIDARGVPVPSKKLGELGLGKNSTEVGLGVLLGGDSDQDTPPFWLEGGKRAIPNISDFEVPDYAVFADRARRHTGLSLVGSFPTGPESLSRRFAITTDLRLAPATKIKADTGSPFHGVELTDTYTLPLAFVRAQGARTYKIIKGKVTPAEEAEHRSVHALTGKMRTVEGVKYYRTRDKRWLHQLDVGLAIAPSSWPTAAEKNEKWIEIAIGAQTLVLWEGKRPIYATLISSGQAGLEDPKKTTATVRGVFRIRNKHITATMDSNEASTVGGAANTTVRFDSGGGDDDKPAPKRDADPGREKSAAKPKSASKPKSAAKDTKGAKSSGKTAPKSKKDDKSAKAPAGADKKKAPPKAAAPKAPSAPAEAAIPKRGDGVYGVTKRRGEGTFQLRDVPYIQYFESGYALHGAYWHDVFGTPRSHGCVNLSPVDAHRIFLWTDPPVPEGWHAINTGEEMGEGTTVIIHE
jgi:L,D-transpeptidase catalytic domain